jgi:hypothetical protein
MTILSSPPANWKRPAIPKSVKAAVFARQNGRCAEGRVKIGLGFEPFHLDHRPALCTRRFDTEAREGKGDTIPASNDPNFIEAITVAAHKARTFGPGGERRITTRGSDIGEKARVKRLAAKHAPQRRDMGDVEASGSHAGVRRKKAWPAGRKLQSRPFQNPIERTRGPAA